MIYECPSCFLEWKDTKEPLDNFYHRQCSFCGVKHTQKELLNWQMQHLENINPRKLILVIRYFYRYVELELKTLKEQYENEKTSRLSDSGES